MSSSSHQSNIKSLFAWLFQNKSVTCFIVTEDRENDPRSPGVYFGNVDTPDMYDAMAYSAKTLRLCGGERYHGNDVSDGAKNVMAKCKFFNKPMHRVISSIDERSARHIKDDINLILRELNDELDEWSIDALLLISDFLPDESVKYKSSTRIK